MGCCVSSGTKDIKVEPWPSYHETFKGKNAGINSTQVTPKGASGERKQVPRKPEHRPGSEANKNQGKITKPVPRSKSTQTSFHDATKTQATGKQDGTKSRLIQVTEADFTADFLSTEDETRPDKAIENSERPLSPLRPGQARAQPDDHVELESIAEEVIKDIPEKDGDLEVEDLEEDECKMDEQMPSKDIEDCAVEPAQERVDDVDPQIGQTEKVNSKDANCCKSQELKEGKEERNQSEIEMKSYVIEDKELELMIADIMSDTADVAKRDPHGPLNSASEQIKAIEPVEGLNERYSEHLASLPKPIDTDTAEVMEKDKDAEKTAEVHERCSVCLATAPLPTSTEGGKVMGETTDVSLDGIAETAEKTTMGTEAKDDLHEACSVCLATAPPPTSTEAIDPEKDTRQTEHIEALSSDTGAENEHQKTEMRETCSVCLATSSPPTETTYVNETKIEETELVEVPLSDAAEDNSTQKESNDQEVVHEVCSVCLATVPPTNVLEEDHGESKGKTEAAEGSSSLTPADTERKECNEKEAEIHETCSVCLATAPATRVAEESTETEKTVDGESSSANTNREGTAVNPETEPEENPEKSGEMKVTRNLVDSTADMDISEVTQEVGNEIHEACSVCLATTPPTFPAVDIEDPSKGDAEEIEVGKGVNQTCLASEPSEKEDGEFNEAGSICSATDIASSVNTGEVPEEVINPLGTEQLPEVPTLDNGAANNREGIGEVHETCSVCLATGSSPASATDGNDKTTKDISVEDIPKMIESALDTTQDTTDAVTANINSDEPLPQETIDENTPNSDRTEAQATVIEECDNPVAKVSSQVAKDENPTESTEETTGERTESSTFKDGEDSTEATEPPSTVEDTVQASEAATAAQDGTAMEMESPTTEEGEGAAGGVESPATAPEGNPEDKKVAKTAPPEDTAVPVECPPITTRCTEKTNKSKLQDETVIEDNGKEEVHQTCSVCLATNPEKEVTEEAQKAQQAVEIGDAAKAHEACSVCLATVPMTPNIQKEQSEQKIKEKTREEIHETCSVCLAAESPTTQEVATMDKPGDERVVEVHEICSVCMATVNAPSVPAESAPSEKLSKPHEVIPAVLVEDENQTSETVIEVHYIEDIHETCSVCTATGSAAPDESNSSNSKVTTAQQARDDMPEPPDISTEEGSAVNAQEIQDDNVPLSSSPKVASSTNQVESDDFAGGSNQPNIPTGPTKDINKETEDQGAEAETMVNDKKIDDVEDRATESSIPETHTKQGIQSVPVELPGNSEDIHVADEEENTARAETVGDTRGPESSEASAAEQSLDPQAIKVSA